MPPSTSTAFDASKVSGCFQRAAAFVKQIAKENPLQLDDQQKIQLYALFKQSTCGDCDTPCPGMFQYTERAKWNGWHNLQGMSGLEAKRQYVAHVREWLPASRGLLAQEPPKAQGAQDSTDTAFPLNYPRIVLEIVALFAFTSSLLVALHLVQNRFDLVDPRIVKNLAPLLWFLVGVFFVLFVKARVFAWFLLSDDLKRRGGVADHAATKSKRKAKKKKKQARGKTGVVDETPAELQQLGLKVIRNPTMRNERQVVVPYEENAEFSDLGTTVTTYPFTVEQVVESYFRKYKFPLPDPNAPLVLGVDLEEERQLTDYDAVYKRRLLRSRNAAPYIIRRLVNAEELEFVETSLFDKRNRIFYIFVQNKSFRSMGEIEGLCTYSAHPERNDWTEVKQGGRVNIKAVGSSFIQSKMAIVIQSEFNKGTADERALHLKRCTEIFGPPPEEVDD